MRRRQSQGAYTAAHAARAKYRISKAARQCTAPNDAWHELDCFEMTISTRYDGDLVSLFVESQSVYGHHGNLRNDGVICTTDVTKLRNVLVQNVAVFVIKSLPSYLEL